MRLLFAATLLLSASLLFLVQPMIAKMVLPTFGGSPAVWNACMLFFQVALLLAYLYAHFSASRLSVRGQVVLQVGVLVLPVLCLPLSLARGFPGQAAPVFALLSGLALGAGLPFLAVAVTAPLLQRWYSRTELRDPYPLYAASNAGSMLGLLAYPTLVEPNLTLRQQAHLWTAGYVVLALLIGLCGALAWRGGGTGAGARVVPGIPLPVWLKLRWSALAFVPSSLMLGVTTVLCSDVPPVPLLWVAPLALYLLSFILVFSALPPWVHRAFTWLLPGCIAGQVFLALSGTTLALGPQILFHLTTFFVVAMVCHGELARSRPPAEHLTEFYLWLSVGGALGGLCNGLVAPLLFSSVVEFPLVLVAAALLMPALVADQARRRTLDLVLPAALGVSALVVLGGAGARLDGVGRGLLALGCLPLATRPLRFGLGVGALFLANAWFPLDRGELLYQERGFFGISRVVRGSNKRVHWMIHGRVEHGAQALSDNGSTRYAPFLYFAPEGPIGQIFRARIKDKDTSPVAVIGLGAGNLAYYGQAGQELTFYEIDPVVKRIAENPAYFTYLRDSPAHCRVVLGDARLSLTREPDQQLGLLVVDAFAGDAIPMHLLTVEAFELYLRKLAPGGALALHISNNYFELEPVVAAVARQLGLVGLSRRERGSELTEADVRRGRRPSHWLLVARNEASLHDVAGDTRWQPLAGRPEDRAWTDDYSNLLGALR
jgi:hypothetical protein